RLTRVLPPTFWKSFNAGRYGEMENGFLKN
ncbi:unnamed protein product, partial [marine sediment metagenome]